MAYFIYFSLVKIKKTMLSKFKKLNTTANQTINSVNKFQKIMIPVMISKREFQSYTKAKHPGFLDGVAGIYEDTRQGLMLKMDPLRDDNFKPYYHHLSNKIIYFLLLIPSKEKKKKKIN